MTPVARSPSPRGAADRKVVRINGRTVAFDCPVAVGAGQGLVLVFVHSSSFDRRVWRPQMQHFARRHTPLALDLPGHGETSGPACERVEDYRAVVKGLLDALGLRNIIIIGHSLGGVIAQDYALAYPQEVRALALISTGLRFGTSDAQIARWRAHPEEFKAFKESTAQASPDASPRVLRALRGFRQRISLETQLADMTALSRWNSEARFSGITCPMALITGERDVLLEGHRQMHRLAPDSELHVLPGLGHLMLIEQPEPVTRCIADWLARA